MVHSKHSTYVHSFLQLFLSLFSSNLSKWNSWTGSLDTMLHGADSKVSWHERSASSSGLWKEATMNWSVYRVYRERSNCNLEREHTEYVGKIANNVPRPRPWEHGTTSLLVPPHKCVASGGRAQAAAALCPFLQLLSCFSLHVPKFKRQLRLQLPQLQLWNVQAFCNCRSKWNSIVFV